ETRKNQRYVQRTRPLFEVLPQSKHAQNPRTITHTHTHTSRRRNSGARPCLGVLRVKPPRGLERAEGPVHLVGDSEVATRRRRRRGCGGETGYIVGGREPVWLDGGRAGLYYIYGLWVVGHW